MAESGLVARLAALARLELGEGEAERLERDLGAILGHVDRLKALPLSDVSATYWTAEARQGMRPDSSSPGLPVDEGLASAAKRSGRYLLVPGMREDA